MRDFADLDDRKPAVGGRLEHTADATTGSRRDHGRARVPDPGRPACTDRVAQVALQTVLVGGPFDGRRDSHPMLSHPPPVLSCYDYDSGRTTPYLFVDDPEPITGRWRYRWPEGRYR